MKNAFKKLIYFTLSLIFMFSSIIYMLETLGANAPSVSPSLSLNSVKETGLRQSEIENSLFLIDIKLSLIDENYIYVYDNKDSMIKVIDKQTQNYRELNNYYQFNNLKNMLSWNNYLLLLNGDTDEFTCITKDTFKTIEIENQNLLSNLSLAKTVKQFSANNKDYLLICPDNPTLTDFEIAEIKKETQAVSGTQTNEVIKILDVKTFKIDESWSSNNVLTSYEKIYISSYENDLFIMLLSNNILYSFIVDLENILTVPYSIITTVRGLDNSENIVDIKHVKLNNQNNNIFVSYQNKILFYNLNIERNVSVSLEKLEFEINLDNFNITSTNSFNSSIVVSSTSNQCVKVFDLVDGTTGEFSQTTICNQEISPYLYSSTLFSYVETIRNIELMPSPYSFESIVTIPENSKLVIIGEGRYSSGDMVYGWSYVMFTYNNQNYYGYIDQESITKLTETTYSKSFVKCYADTKLYSLPSKFLDNTNKELKIIKESSRLEVISTICDYSSLNTNFILVKVNGDTVGFIDKSRIITNSGISEKIIPNATVKQNNSEIFTSTNSDKEVIIYLNKGDRVKVLGKRDTKTNFTKITFNDSEGNEYIGYIYTHNLEPDTWSMLQIIGLFLVSINVILLIIIICIKNKITR